jgi:hypothetical protein
MSRSEEAAGLVSRAEARRQTASAQLDPKKRAKLGQFLTPAMVADFMAALPSLPDTGSVRLLDPHKGLRRQRWRCGRASPSALRPLESDK